jgi:hypothetical protein
MHQKKFRLGTPHATNTHNTKAALYYAMAAAASSCRQLFMTAAAVVGLQHTLSATTIEVQHTNIRCLAVTSHHSCSSSSNSSMQEQKLSVRYSTRYGHHQWAPSVQSTAQLSTTAAAAYDQPKVCWRLSISAHRITAADAVRQSPKHAQSCATTTTQDTVHQCTAWRITAVPALRHSTQCRVAQRKTCAHTTPRTTRNTASSTQNPEAFHPPRTHASRCLCDAGGMQ